MILEEAMFVFLALGAAVHSAKEWKASTVLGRLWHGLLIVLAVATVLSYGQTWITPPTTNADWPFRLWGVLFLCILAGSFVQHFRELRSSSPEDRSTIIRRLVALVFVSVAYTYLVLTL